MFKRKIKHESIFDIVMKKYQNKEKITYEEYVILLSTNDEIWFVHDNIEYQVDHSEVNLTSMYSTEYLEGKEIINKCDTYKNIV